MNFKKEQDYLHVLSKAYKSFCSMSHMDSNIIFMKKFLTSPRTIGSITPSSRFLANSMLKNVNWEKVRNIAELGAGTGVFTKEIMHRMHPESRFFVFEVENEMRRCLSERTGLDVYGSASLLPEVLSVNGLKTVDVIISGLPFAVLPKEVTRAVIDGVINSLDDDGVFVTFQYSLHMRETLEKLFRHVQIRFVSMNIPPAFVYECRNKACETNQNAFWRSYFRNSKSREKSPRYILSQNKKLRRRGGEYEEK